MDILRYAPLIRLRPAPALSRRDHFFRWNQHALEYLWARLEPEYKARCPLNMPHPQARSSAADEYYI